MQVYKLLGGIMSVISLCSPLSVCVCVRVSLCCKRMGRFAYEHNCCFNGAYSSIHYFFFHSNFPKTSFKPYYQIRFSFFRLKFANIYYFIVIFCVCGYFLLLSLEETACTGIFTRHCFYLVGSKYGSPSERFLFFFLAVLVGLSRFLNLVFHEYMPLSGKLLP